MHRLSLSAAFVALAATASACVPPREQVDGRSADGRMTVQLDLRPMSGDSVGGSGIVRLAGAPHVVKLRGQWHEKGDGLRRLAATLQSDSTPTERWSLEWSPVSRDGTIRDGEADSAAIQVALGSR